MDGAVFADGMLHFARLGFRVVVPVAADIGKEIGREEFGGRDARIDSEIDQMLIDERADFRSGIGDIERFVFVALLDHTEEIAEAAGGAAIRVACFVRQNEVEAFEELLEIDLEIGARRDFGESAGRGVNNCDFGRG
jgi:hypothetical protein